jgi:chemotaxis protein CheD
MAEKKETMQVPIGGAVIAKGEVIIETYGLGSCIALILYDSSTSIGGLAHVMLPDPKKKASNPSAYRYCNTAVPKLIEEMCRKGAKRENIKAKLIGGSKMFSTLVPKETMDIGMKNVRGARSKLVQCKIPLVAKDTGGTHGRSIKFYISDGRVKVSSYYEGVRYL